MKYIIGENRNQSYLFPISLEKSIDIDNEVRFIDVFVESLKLESMGFKLDHIENGRPAYHPKDLLKLYIYGYMNRIRSSRELERASKINIEVMWLLKNLSPDHNTISNFRRDNPKSIKQVFRSSVELAKNFELIGGNLLAGDSTKIRAQNSKKNNYNEKKIKRHLEYIDNKLGEYNKQLSENDGDNKAIIEKEIEKHQLRKQNYQKLQQELSTNQKKQISTSDPESRHMITRNNITEVAYNVQSTVDDLNKIPIDYLVTNENDSKAMGKMLRRSKTILGHNHFISLYDKGYHTGSEFKIAKSLGLEVLVAIPKVAANAPNKAYNVSNFKYNKTEDYYVCPQYQELHSTGKWHQSKTFKFKRYISKSCMTCPVKNECSKAKYGKAIQRSEYQELIDNNKERIQKNKEYYRLRQAIVEHPYGTIKRQWGFNYIMTKKYIKRAKADMGLVFTAYTLRRIISIIGIKKLISYLSKLVHFFITHIGVSIVKIKRFKPLNYFPQKIMQKMYIHQKALFLLKISVY